MTQPGDPDTLDQLRELNDLRAMNQRRGLALADAVLRIHTLEEVLKRLVTASGTWEECVLEERCQDCDCEACRGDEEYLAALAAARDLLQVR